MSNQIDVKKAGKIILVIFMVAYFMLLMSYSQIMLSNTLKIPVNPIFNVLISISFIALGCCGAYIPIARLYIIIDDLKYQNLKKDFNYFETIIRLNGIDEETFVLQFPKDSAMEIETTKEMDEIIMSTKAYKSLKESFKNGFKNIIMDDNNLFSIDPNSIPQETPDSEEVKHDDNEKGSNDEGDLSEIEGLEDIKEFEELDFNNIEVENDDEKNTEGDNIDMASIIANSKVAESDDQKNEEKEIPNEAKENEPLPMGIPDFEVDKDENKNDAKPNDEIKYPPVPMEEIPIPPVQVEHVSTPKNDANIKDLERLRQKLKGNKEENVKEPKKKSTKKEKPVKKPLEDVKNLEEPKEKKEKTEDEIIQEKILKEKENLNKEVNYELEEMEKEKKNESMTINDHNFYKIFSMYHNFHVPRLQWIINSKMRIYYLHLSQPIIFQQGYMHYPKEIHDQRGIVGMILVCPDTFKECFDFKQTSVFDMIDRRHLESVSVSFPTLNFIEYIFPTIPLLVVSECNITQKKIWKMRINNSVMSTMKEEVLKYFSYLAQTNYDQMNKYTEELRVKVVDANNKIEQLRTEKFKTFIREGDVAKHFEEEYHQLEEEHKPWSWLLLGGFAGFIIGLLIGMRVFVENYVPVK